MAVTHIWRYAVKGLDRDELPSVKLVPGDGIPGDRRWALHYEELPDAKLAGRFDPAASKWLHKSNFLCAFTAPEMLGLLETSYVDATDTLTMRRRSDGQQLVEACLTDPAGRAHIEALLFGMSGKKVTLVQGDVPHHFGNTPAGFKHHRSGSIIHIVNADTVASVAEAIGCPLNPSRFRPNIVVKDLPAWSEFDWVGKCVCIGGVTLEVVSRTVRCEAINVDARHGSGKADLDMSALLKAHFPQHGPYLGVYARVVRGGVVHVSDKVQPPDPCRTVVSRSTMAIVAAAGILAVLFIAKNRMGTSAKK